MQRFVDNVLGVAKESLKACSQETFNNTIKIINGVSALILTFLPGKATILEGVQGWELRPTLRAPRLPRWMEEGVSSFNEFIHEYTADSDPDSESEYESGLEDNDSVAPSSPSSQSSQFSQGSSSRHKRRNSFRSKGGSFPNVVPNFLKRMFCTASSQELRRSDSPPSPPRRSNSSGSLYHMYGLASKGLTNFRDFVVHRTTDRRRGVIEDAQLVVELSIERVFDVVRKVLLYCLSPLQTSKLLFKNIFTYEEEGNDTQKVQTATLGDSNPTPSVKKERHYPAMNTDARSCEDVITDLGYPYEAIRVVTDDGYVLLIERIPRPDSQKVLYLQHGMLDTSLGWVSSGVVGSQAFAAHDQGYDVFLGNFRGLASKDHVNKSLSSLRYWQYSVNEHGTQDIPAIINKIHDMKMEELTHLKIVSSEILSSTEQPYTICGLAHSLGGAGLLVYVVTRRVEGKPHRLSRLILLSPAGFHKEAPFLVDLLQYLVPWLECLAAPLVPGLYIPTQVFRGLFNKLARDFQNYPALGGLVQTLCSYVVGGDSSNWVEALGQSHYNVYDMPGVAYRVVVHLAQMRRADRFQMFDYGSAKANMAVYGSPHPLDIGGNYGLIDIPVDVVGGCKDKLIPKANVRRHYHTLKESGCTVSYSEFEYAHLDFTFAHREELLAYVMSKLLLVSTPTLASSSKATLPKSGRTKGEPKRDVKKPKTSRPGKVSEHEEKDVLSGSDQLRMRRRTTVHPEGSDETGRE